ncbi:vWA domain-containing protein [Kitasatospora terrestris]|uniref:vWA domain-containing protein n=1 Tax=Kitasatospora terrestris TaxID=258051 RepID=UPI0031EDDD23
MVADPRDAVEALAASTRPHLIGVRHHSPALAAVLPALLDAADPQVVCVELPADFQHWLPHLADPGTVAPVALAGADRDGRLGFYPFADFSPELAAIRWAREHGVDVLCCDLPLGDKGWHAGSDPAAHRAGPTYADGLQSAGTGRDGDDLWDRSVEVRAPGSTPDAVRRAALAVGWALRQDAAARGGVPAGDLAREARMREVIAHAATGGRRVTAVIGSFHAPALSAPPAQPDAPSADGGPQARPLDGTTAGTDVPDSGLPADTPSAGAGPGAGGPPATLPEAASADVPSTGAEPGAVPVGLLDVPAGEDGPVTSLVPYTFDLLDARSGYPAGIRDPRWQQAVLTAQGDPGRVYEAAARAITDVCRELRGAGHPAGTGEAAETLRLAGDLARLRGLPAPGRGELLEAVSSVLGQGEPLGRGRALARALETVLVGADRGRLAPGTPRSGLGPSVEAELAELRLPCPDDPESRELRLDPLRSALDGRREVLLQRLTVCGVGYGTPIDVSGTGDGSALTTRWRMAWTPSATARLDLAGVRGVTAELAAAGTLRETARRQAADGGPTCAQALDGLRAAARCDLPALVAERLDEAGQLLPASATLPELLDALELLEALRRAHLPGTTEPSRERAGELAVVLLDAAVRALPGLAGSEEASDAAALVALATRAGDHRLGLRMDDALDGLARTGSPLIQGAALASRVLLDLDTADRLGTRAAGWVDAAADAVGRLRLARLLTGLLTAGGPLLQYAPDALGPLLGRIDALPDGGFLERLPALRAGFDALSPAGRGRLLDTVAERLGERPDLTLAAPPALLALWTAADTAAAAALTALGLPGLPATTAQPSPVGPPSDARAGSVDPAAGRAADPAPPSATAAPGGAHSGSPVPAPDATGTALPTQDGPAADAAPGPAQPVTDPVPGTAPRLAPADRWRLLLGREPERLPEHARRYAHALDELYGAGRGEGAGDLTGGSGSGGGQEASFPTAREWSAELEALFGADVREEVLAAAADAGRTDVLAELDPASVRPSVELLTSVLNLAGGMPEHQLARLRPLVRRLVDELARELATRLRPALTGLATPRPTRRPGGRIDLPRTLRANLAHTRRLEDGRTVVVPEQPVFSTRSRREADWRLVLVVDVSGSMEASVIWSALTAAVLGGVPTLSTHFLAFSTQVADLTERVSDPLSLLLEVKVGGGTHIAGALAHARSLVTVPSRTLMVVVSDFEEGYPLGGLLGEVRALASSGVHLMGCAALDDAGAPRYSVPVARQLVAAGMPVAALSPLALARWVGDRLRGEPR